jgi:hypothetical protein
MVEKKKKSESCTKSEFEVLTISLVKLLKLGHSPTGILAIFFFSRIFSNRLGMSSNSLINQLPDRMACMSTEDLACKGGLSGRTRSI